MNSTADLPAGIVVFMPNWVGDLVMATPTLRALRNGFPDTDLTVVLRPYVAELLAGGVWQNRTVVVDERFLSGFVRGVRAVRSARPDTAVLLSHSLRPAVMARLSGARRRLGYERGSRGMFLTDVLELPEKSGGTPRYMGLQYMALAERVGCPPDNGRPELPVSDDEEGQAESMLAPYRASGPLVGIAPGASFGSSKLWPPERFAAVASELIGSDGAHIVVLAAPSEQHILERIASHVTEPDGLVDVGMPSLSLLKSIVKRFDLLITTDSGVRHTAVAFEVPTVVLMGPTRPEYTTNPVEKGVLLRHDVDCGPCHQPTCPTDHRCMKLITVDEVVTAARRLLPTRP